MNAAHSCHDDPRLRGAGGRRVWPWVRSVVLFISGALLVYPGGIALGLALRLGPDATPFSWYVWLGLAANLAVSTLVLFAKTKWHALSLFSPAGLVLLVEILRHL